MTKRINNAKVLIGFAAVISIITTSIVAYAANENRGHHSDFKRGGPYHDNRGTPEDHGEGGTCKLLY